MKSLAIAALAAAILVPSVTQAWDAVVVPATRKVVPTASMDFPKQQHAAIAGCRNEWESFQIVVSAAEPVTGVNVVMSPLSDGADGLIQDKAFTLYREWFLNVVNPSGGGWAVPNHDRLPGLYPDPLIPFIDPYADAGEAVPVGAPFDITADDSGLAVVWVDIHIPADATPGVYTGTATLSATDQSDIVIPVTLEVWELDMPKEKNVGTAFRMSDSQVRKYHGGTDQNETDKNFPEIVRNYYIAGHEHRIDPTGFTGPVEFKFDEAGALLPVDWTAYDTYMTPFVEGGYFPDGVGVARFDVGMFGAGKSRSMTDDQYQQASRALAQHLYDKGWWDKAWVYSKDEPWLVNPLEGDTQEEADAEMAAVANDSRLLVEGSDLWKGHILVTGPSYEQAAPYVGIWCPVHPMFDQWWWTGEDYAGRGDYDEHVAAGGELWFYNCNANLPPFAGYDIDTAIGYEPRILKWGSWWEGATGYLYWRQLYWSYFDPWLDWQSIDNFSPIFARNGDGLLMYPGDGNGYLVDDDGNPVTPGTPSWLHIDGPIVSFRMKQIRDGLEDWELFILAEKAGIGEWTRNEVSRAYQRFGAFTELDCAKENYYCPEREPWTLDENVLLDVRSRVAAKLLFTMYPERYPDPDAPIITEPVEIPPETTEITGLDASTADTGGETSDTSEPEVRADSGTVDDNGPDEGRGNGCAADSTYGTPVALMLLAICLLALFTSRRRNTAV